MSAGIYISISIAPSPLPTMTVSTGRPAAPSMSGTMSPSSAVTGMDSTAGVSMSSTGSMSLNPGDYRRRGNTRRNDLQADDDRPGHVRSDDDHLDVGQCLANPG